MIRTLTADELDTLDRDQRSAVLDYVRHHLGPEAVANCRELRFTPALDTDTPALLEARVTDELEHPDGTLEPAAWFATFGATTPPAWKRWTALYELDVAGPVVADVIEPETTGKRRRRRT